jgi:phosphoadenosine phosphosulfate reductase
MKTATAGETTPYAGDGTAGDVLRWALERFHPRIAVATSLQDAVLIHMAATIRPDVRVFSIDTGRLPESAYECAEQIRTRLGVKIEWYFPKHEAVETLETEQGPFSFKNSLEARQACCRIRKVEPLNRALGGLAAWVTGQRRDEAATRGSLEKVERDVNHGGIWKINPLADWTTEQVRDYLRRNRLPYNRLLDEGYPSIGCACCTRPVEPGADPRSGRWWWEQEGHKECGLHVRNWNI